MHLVTLVCSEEFVDIDCFHLFFPENTKKDSAKPCPTLVIHVLQPARLLCPWDSPGKNTAARILEWVALSFSRGSS